MEINLETTDKITELRNNSRYLLNEILNLKQAIDNINNAYELIKGRWPLLVAEKVLANANQEIVVHIKELLLEIYGIKNITITFPDEYFETIDFDKIFEYVLSILNNASDLAYKEILRSAKRLLPYEVGHISETLQNTTLNLKAYFRYGVIHMEDGIMDIEKLINIVLDGVKPEHATATDFSLVINERLSYNEFNQVGTYQSTNPKIDSIRIYKNGKIAIKFHNKADAEKVAHALRN